MGLMMPTALHLVLFGAFQGCLVNFWGHSTELGGPSV